MTKVYCCGAPLSEVGTFVNLPLDFEDLVLINSVAFILLDFMDPQSVKLEPH